MKIEMQASADMHHQLRMAARIRDFQTVSKLVRRT